MFSADWGAAAGAVQALTMSGTSGVVSGGAGANTSNSHAVTNVGSARLEPDARTVQVSVRRTGESG